MQNEILVAYDFSPMADAALEWAAQEARGGAPVKVIHVLALQPYTEGVISIPPPTPAEISKLASDVEARAKRAGVSAEVVIEVGASVADTILEIAKTDRARQIVLGTHGRSGITRAILGSVADQVARHALCPVTTVRTRATA